MCSRGTQSTDRILLYWPSTQHKDAEPLVVTRVRSYSTPVAGDFAAGHVVVAETSFPRGIADTGGQPTVDSASTVASAFPSLHLGAASAEDVGYAQYAGTFLIRSTAGCATGTLKNFSSFVNGIDGGPFSLFSQTAGDGAAFVSPASSFMAAASDIDGEHLRMGMLGSIAEIPPGFSLSFSVASHAEGINAALREWGELLRAAYGKVQRGFGPAADVPTRYLGYNTDHGAYYYYNPDFDGDYGQTLRAVKEYADEQGIPYKWALLDSWFYPKDEHMGVTRWTSNGTGHFGPDGDAAIAQLSKSTNWPWVAHNRFWSPNATYAKQNGGKYDFIIDTNGTGYQSWPMGWPDSQQFWDDLLANAKHWGVTTYEQDWLYNELHGVKELLTSATRPRQWLMQMGEGAQKSGMTVQYCMPVPRFALQSLEIAAVAQIRVSDDYVPNSGETTQWRIGDSNMFAGALGLAPFKDSFWTTSLQPGSSVKNNTEPAPALQALVSTLSAGLVTPSDGVGHSNAGLIRRSCNADGLLLKPDRPAASLDVTFRARAFFSSSALGTVPAGAQLWAARSSPTAAQGAAPTRLSCADVHVHVFAGDLPDGLDALPLGDVLQAAGAAACAAPKKGRTMVPYWIPADAPSHDVAHLKLGGRVDAGSSAAAVAIPAAFYPAYALVHLAPLRASGWALLGELGKWVPVASQRFAAVEDGDGASGQQAAALTAELRGAPGEEVEVAFLSPEGKVVTDKVTIGKDGTALARARAAEA